MQTGTLISHMARLILTKRRAKIKNQPHQYYPEPSLENTYMMMRSEGSITMIQFPMYNSEQATVGIQKLMQDIKTNRWEI